MKSWKLLICLLAFLPIFEVFIPTQPVTAKSCPGENSQDSRSIRYKWRQNRCEGVVGYNLSATPFLISFSLNNLRQFNQTATLEVKSLNNADASDVRAVAFLPNEYYLVDNIQPSNFRYFTWDTQILNGLSIQPQSLWLLAKSATSVYLPVQLGEKSPEYKFAFMSNS